MKSMMNDSDDGNNDSWLGFSLSPHMKMEAISSSSSGPSSHHHFYHHLQSSNDSVPTSFYLSHSQVNPSGFCYSVGENSSFHSPSLTMMPLKSDGSLCIMEALTRSQTHVMMPSSSPKLEDFLGGATMGGQDYGGSQEREAMALSLDSIYYNQTQNAEQHETNRNHSSLDLLSDPFRQNVNVQSHNPFYGIFQTPPLEEVSVTKEPHFIAQVANEGCFSSQHNLEQQVNSTIGASSGSVVGSGELKSLSLSMSPGSQSSCVTIPRQIEPSETKSVVVEAKKRGPPKKPVHRKSIDTFGQRTSQYRGVTRHRWTGRYEAHLWDNSCKKEGQTRKGRQVYLGGYDMEEKAARAYDLAALKYWGPSTHINFPLENYQTQLEEMKNMTRQEYVAHLRRKSSGFSRGASMYRGVTRHHQHGRWQARIGRVAGNKDLYLGTFSTQEEAAEAYDIAAIKFRGVNAVTNFDISRYDVERIMASNTLLAGELARRNKKETESTRIEAIEYNNTNAILSNQITTNREIVEAAKNNNNDSIRNSVFSVALQDLIGIDSVGGGSSQGSMVVVDETMKIGSHFSNPSSLVTSLSSSREPSPDKSGPTSLISVSKPPIGSKIVAPISTGVTSWFPSANGASAISMSHLPVFAAWGDV